MTELNEEVNKNFKIMTKKKKTEVEKAFLKNNNSVCMYSYLSHYYLFKGGEN